MYISRPVPENLLQIIKKKIGENGKKKSENLLKTGQTFSKGFELKS